MDLFCNITWPKNLRHFWYYKNSKVINISCFLLHNNIKMLEIEDEKVFNNQKQYIKLSLINISNFGVSLAYFINMLFPSSNPTRKGTSNGRWTSSWTGNFPTKVRTFLTLSNSKFAKNLFLFLFYINIQIFWVDSFLRQNYFKQLKIAFTYSFEMLSNLPYLLDLS